MSRAEGINTQWLFPCLLISFCAIYLLYYPPSYGIEDEGNILQLSYSLSHGTIYPDHAGPYAGPSIDGHRVSKFSAFHAAMIAPFWKLDWRLGFGLAALFFAAGAFFVGLMRAPQPLPPPLLIVQDSWRQCGKPLPEPAP